jgi:hypothetical protein
MTRENKNFEECNQELFELADIGLEEAKMIGKSQKEIFQAMGLSENGGNKAKSEGYLLSKTKSFFAFARATQSNAVRKYALQEMNIVIDKEQEAFEMEIEKLKEENLQLHQELEDYKKLVADIGLDLKKNMNQLTDFLIKKNLKQLT